MLESLFAALDYRLIVVVAAAGYGKTSLLAQFARTEGFSFSWLTLDENDADLRVFGEALVSALQQSCPGFGAQTMQLLTSASIIEQNMGLLARTLVRELAACMSQPLCIVLDDFHLVEACMPVIQFVDQLLAELPEEAHLIIASRTLPPLQLGVLIAQQQVTALGQTILRLDMDETRQMLAALNGIKPEEVTDAEANKALAATEGWLVGLLMTNHIDRLHKAQVGLGAPRAIDLLANYLLVQVWQALPETLRGFLCKSSILNDISIPFCIKELGWTDAAAHIAEIERRNLFIQQIGSPDTPTSYRYHPLFREFLRLRLREDEPLRFAQLQHDVGVAYENNNETELAVRHYLTGNWCHDVIRLIELHAQPMLQRGLYHTILDWLNRLDASAPGVWADRHVLWQFKIWAHLNLGEDVHAMEALNRLDELYLHTGDMVRRQSLNIRRSLLLWRAGEFEEALAGTLEITHSIYKPLLWVRIEALRIAAMCLNELGQLNQALASISNAEQLAYDWEQAGNGLSALSEVLARCKLTHSLILDCLGDASGALRAAAEAVGLAEQLQDNSLRAEATIDLAEQLIYSESKEDLLEISRHGLELAEGVGNQALRVYGMTTLAQIFMQRGQFESTLEATTAALALARQITASVRDSAPAVNERGVILFRALIQYAHVMHRMAQSEYALEKRANHLQQAASLAREAVAIAENNQSPRLRLQAYARLGAILATLGETGSAARVLDSAESVLGQIHNTTTGTTVCDNAVGAVYLWKVMLLWNDPTPDIERLRHFVAEVHRVHAMRQQSYFIQAEGQDAWDTWQAISSSPDIETALQARRSSLADTASQLSTAARSLPMPAILADDRRGDSPRVASSALRIVVQHDLRVFGFGAGRVWRNDQPVTTSQWGWSIPRDLFFYILTMQKATRAEIGLIFWPESSTATMQSSFHNAKFAIKTALGKPAMVYVNGAYSVNPDLDFLYDVNSFEHLIAEAQQASPQVALDHLINAAALYTDDFLTETDTVWAVQLRSTLAQKYAACCVQAARLALELAKPDAVLSLLETATRHDPLNEAVAQMLIKCQWQNGNRRAALQTYARLKAGLYDELGIMPDAETERLILTIKNSP